MSLAFASTGLMMGRGELTTFLLCWKSRKAEPVGYGAVRGEGGDEEKRRQNRVSCMPLAEGKKREEEDERKGGKGERERRTTTNANPNNSAMMCAK
jgi:hypothetical protein